MKKDIGEHIISKNMAVQQKKRSRKKLKCCFHRKKEIFRE